HLQARAQTASVREQQLRLEAARLESPERVVDDAERLGMVPPALVRYLTPAAGGQNPAPTASTTPPTTTVRAATPPRPTPARATPPSASRSGSAPCTCPPSAARSSTAITSSWR